jgi:hypothetical protein
MLIICGNSEKVLASIWNDTIMAHIEKEVEYTVNVKESSLEHPSKFLYLASGLGCFLSCKNKKYVIPGTLLAYMPGEITATIPNDSYANAEKKYCTRADQTYINFSKPIPYPNNFEQGI